jgi:hypothetical protein
MPDETYEQALVRDARNLEPKGLDRLLKRRVDVIGSHPV